MGLITSRDVTHAGIVLGGMLGILLACVALSSVAPKWRSGIGASMSCIGLCASLLSAWSAGREARLIRGVLLLSAIWLPLCVPAAIALVAAGGRSRPYCSDVALLGAFMFVLLIAGVHGLARCSRAPARGAVGGCRRCGYMVKGLSSTRCPECGLPTAKDGGGPQVP